MQKKPKLGVVSKSGKIAWKKEKVSFMEKWNALPLYEAMQIVVLIVTMVSFTVAAVYSWMEDWHTATKIWMVAFFCMYLVWVLERRKRSESDYIRANLPK